MSECLDQCRIGHRGRTPEHSNSASVDKDRAGGIAADVDYVVGGIAKYADNAGTRGEDAGDRLSGDVSVPPRCGLSRVDVVGVDITAREREDGLVEAGSDEVGCHRLLLAAAIKFGS
ncbi:MAG: hypothetical protein PHD43_02790 [Methylococcales bacterium]|nr:hypothetical protein [Methylococcales bacterium]